MEESTQKRPPARPIGTAVLTLAGLAAALGAASCCGLPFVLASLGIGSAWLAGFALLAAPHRALLLAAAALALAGGGFLLLRAWRPTACSPGSVRARSLFRGAMLAALAAGGWLLYLGFAYV